MKFPAIENVMFVLLAVLICGLFWVIVCVDFEVSASGMSNDNFSWESYPSPEYECIVHGLVDEVNESSVVISFSGEIRTRVCLRCLSDVINEHLPQLVKVVEVNDIGFVPEVEGGSVWVESRYGMPGRKE